MCCITPPRGAEALDRLAGQIEPTLVAVLSDINNGDEDRQRQAAEHGAAEFLTKPVDFERLKAQLGELPSVRD